jgi:hypothetical protein
VNGNDTLIVAVHVNGAVTVNRLVVERLKSIGIVKCGRSR